jgi:hypothetical protein
MWPFDLVSGSFLALLVFLTVLRHIVPGVRGFQLFGQKVVVGAGSLFTASQQ